MMRDLKLGQSVATLNPEGVPVTTRFIGWLHRDTMKEATFLQIRTSNGCLISLTPDHIILEASGMKLAGQLQLGDQLCSRQGVLTIVTDISEIRHTGVFSPLTTTSTLLVDGLLASCFARSNSNTIAPNMVTTYHRQAHFCFGPVRLCPSIMEDERSQEKVTCSLNSTP